jgi:hypothetical protein
MKLQKTAILGTAHVLREVLMWKFKTFYMENKIACATNRSCRRAATLCTPKNMVCFSYVICACRAWRWQLIIQFNSIHPLTWTGHSVTRQTILQTEHPITRTGPSLLPDKQYYKQNTLYHKQGHHSYHTNNTTDRTTCNINRAITVTTQTILQTEQPVTQTGPSQLPHKQYYRQNNL